MKKAIVLVANGSEEIETITVIDVLRRANIQVCVLGVEELTSGTLTLSRNVRIAPDETLTTSKAYTNYDALILPGGGKGAETFCKVSIQTNYSIRMKMFKVLLKVTFKMVKSLLLFALLLLLLYLLASVKV
jgi:enhancing lycopene biosynthesis protein 2